MTATTSRPPSRSRPTPRGRAPVDVSHMPTVSARHFAWAKDLVDQLGPEFHNALAAASGDLTGRPGSVSAYLVLLGWALLVSQRHQAEVTDVTGALVAMTDAQLETVGAVRLPERHAYKRVHDKFTRVIRALDAGFEVLISDGGSYIVDSAWFSDRLVAGSMPADLGRSRSAAVDGTDWETCGRFRGPRTKMIYDGDAPADTSKDPEVHARDVARMRGRARGSGQRTFPVGSDGRSVYTSDPDARGGHRSATNSRSSGPYIGYEVHLMVQIQDISWAGDPTTDALGEEVPAFVTGVAVAPAGTHRGTAALPMILRQPTQLKQVAWDRGYSILAFENAHAPLWANGIEPVFDLNTAPRQNPLNHPDVLMIDGHPFHPGLPDHLRDLARAPENVAPAVRTEAQRLYNERAQWRYTRHSAPDNDGYTRWICPFHAGRLKCRRLRQAKINKSAPLVELPASMTRCCNGIVRLSARHLRAMQGLGIPWGTTAHAKSYGRRNLVETANSYLAGHYVTLDRNYTRLMGLAKRQFIAAFTVAGLNRYIELAWRRRIQESARRAATPLRHSRARRRTDVNPVRRTVGADAARPQESPPGETGTAS